MSIMEQFELSNKTAIVTGAGRGIGKASALALAQAGAKVYAIARTESDLNELASAHQNITPYRADVTCPSFLEFIAGLERLDILVNNVGTNRPEAFAEVSLENLDLVLNLNVRTAFLVAQAAAKKMLEHKSGSIIHMSSQMGHVGAPNRTVYCMTKHAIEGLSKAMAVELAPQGVRVNTIAPTFIETPMTKPMLEDQAFQKDVLSRIPRAKIGQVEEVASAVVFLASDASSLVVGDSLKVDGGWTAI